MSKPAPTTLPLAVQLTSVPAIRTARARGLSPDTVLPTRVLLVGAGGIGARVLPLLTKLLAGQPGASITVLDHDRVEEKNLLRQPFIKDDVGEYKSVVMAERYSTAAVPVIGAIGKFSKEYYSRWRTMENLPYTPPTFLFGCVDNGEARALMLSAMQTAAQLPTAYFDAGNDGNRGQVVIAYARWFGRNIMTPQAPQQTEISRWFVLEGALRYPDVFDSRADKVESCDAADTQTVMANATAAVYLCNYLSAFLHGAVLGSAGLQFNTMGGVELHKLAANGIFETGVPKFKAETPPKTEAPPIDLSTRTAPEVAAPPVPPPAADGGQQPSRRPGDVGQRSAGSLLPGGAQLSVAVLPVDPAVLRGLSTPLAISGNTEPAGPVEANDAAGQDDPLADAYDAFDEDSEGIRCDGECPDCDRLYGPRPNNDEDE